MGHVADGGNACTVFAVSGEGRNRVINNALEVARL
jgi:hypothetical protein